LRILKILSSSLAVPLVSALCLNSHNTLAANPLALKEADLRLMLAANVHIGTKNMNKNMERYVWRRRQDGIYIINLGKTWEKLMLAARIIVAIENPQDLVVISGRPFGQRAVFKFAQHTGCQYIAGRYTPGTFTNQIAGTFMEPRLLLVCDPHVDHQPVTESASVNMPVIALCDSDTPLKFVDVAIPCNNKGKHSIALIMWFLAREVNRLRDRISRVENWNVMVDLFMFRDPEAEDEGGEAAKDDFAVEPAAGDAKVSDWGNTETNYGETNAGGDSDWQVGQASY